MTARATLDRRELLTLGAAMAGTGLVVGIARPRPAGAQGAPPPFAPDAFIRVGADGVVTVVIGYSEMGQGISTALPMLVAEELEVDAATIRVEQAPADMRYANPLFGLQGTGGSTTVRAMHEPMRRAGAAAREMLAAAAAEAMGLPRDQLVVRGGTVAHEASGRRMSYGQLAAAAGRRPVPQNVALKPPSAWRVLGRPQRRLDAAAKVRGQATFGIDVRLPGLLTAVVARCPVFGGTVTGFDAARARRVPGVRHVVQLPAGVAVVADGYWAAKKGRDALTVRWDEGATAALTSAALSARYAELAQQSGRVAKNEGDADAALRDAARRHEAIFEVPYLAHATMEPMNCTAHVRADAVEVWAPTQFQTSTQQTAAQIAGLPPAAVQVHTTYLGGGFGRRAELDFVDDAVRLSKEVRAPVKVVYTREDDIQHDMYRPATYTVMRAGLGTDGLPTAWWARVVGASIFARFFPQMFNGMDESSVEGLTEHGYGIPNQHVEWVRHESGVPVGFWRSVGNTQNAFIKECFVDELAQLAGQDPVAYRRTLLAGHPRLLGVLNAAAERAGWGSSLPAGRARGVAVHESFGSFVAEVAEVSIEGDAPVVHRVVCAADVGTVVNPLTVEAQMESAIVYGLSAALRGEITIDRGRVVQSNFHDYQPLRMHEMPRVEVHLVPSTNNPGGVGEPGTPPIAPAVCNALFALTGRRIRRLPIRPEDLRRA